MSPLQALVLATHRDLAGEKFELKTRTADALFCRATLSWCCRFFFSLGSFSVLELKLPAFKLCKEVMTQGSFES